MSGQALQGVDAIARQHLGHARTTVQAAELLRSRCKAGNLVDAFLVVRCLKPVQANEVLLCAGFSTSGISSARFWQEAQENIAQASRLGVDGYGLRNSTEIAGRIV